MVKVNLSEDIIRKLEILSRLENLGIKYIGITDIELLNSKLGYSKDIVPLLYEVLESLGAEFTEE